MGVGVGAIGDGVGDGVGVGVGAGVQLPPEAVIIPEGQEQTLEVSIFGGGQEGVGVGDGAGAAIAPIRIGAVVTGDWGCAGTDAAAAAGLGADAGAAFIIGAIAMALAAA